MPEARERDFLVELEDAKRVNSVEMQSIVNRLPASDLLAVSDVASALHVSPVTVYQLIEGGSLRVINLGTKGRNAKPYYKVFRVSVLEYIKSHIS